MQMLEKRSLPNCFSTLIIDYCCIIIKVGIIFFAQSVRTSVINKRAGGMGMISGRKAFQRPMVEGVKLLNAIQDVYLDDSVTVA